MTYEYACEACGHQWEAEQSIKDAPLKTCVTCGKQTAKRLISGGTGFLLKGGGWYADGYGSKSPASSSSSTSDAPATKSNTSSESSTPAAKTETPAKAPATSESSSPKSDSTKASSSPST